MKNTIWVLTTSYNLYDQEGDYFISAWLSKPSLETLSEMVGGDASHVFNGGGRINYEHMWYNLVEIGEGEKYNG